MDRNQIKRLVFAAVFLALGLLLPFLTGQIPQFGSRLLPMHIPVLLCGMICGWQYGLIVGIVTPLLRSVIFSMPPMMPTALVMAFELAAYGAFAGLLLSRLPKGLPSLYIALVSSMLIGRIVYGVAGFVFYRLAGSTFTWEIFMANAFINAVPGIIVQLLIIPVIVAQLSRIKDMPTPVWKTA